MPLKARIKWAFSSNVATKGHKRPRYLNFGRNSHGPLLYLEMPLRGIIGIELDSMMSK